MKENNRITLTFQQNDFYNSFQEEIVINKLSSLQDNETYIKEAVIHRASIENQSDSEAYKKLMKIIYTHGVDKIIGMFEESSTSSLQKEDVERIVYEILGKHTLSPQPIIKEDISSLNQENGSSEIKRKPSSKLKKL